MPEYEKSFPATDKNSLLEISNIILQHYREGDTVIVKLAAKGFAGFIEEMQNEVASLTLKLRSAPLIQLLRNHGKADEHLLITEREVVMNKQIFTDFLSKIMGSIDFKSGKQTEKKAKVAAVKAAPNNILYSALADSLAETNLEYIEMDIDAGGYC